MIQILQSLAAHYHVTKVKFSAATGASEELLHLHAGLLIFVVTALVLRRRMRSPVPILCVVGFALANELLDIISGKGWRPLEPYFDVANTVFWPLILFLLAKRWK